MQLRNVVMEIVYQHCTHSIKSQRYHRQGFCGHGPLFELLRTEYDVRAEPQRISAYKQYKALGTKHGATNRSVAAQPSNAVKHAVGKKRRLHHYSQIPDFSPRCRAMIG
ncbi:hypothetical protein CIHG_02130 [Coccidioides immitis H538.4]|uniref:Uncharacterized protein n=3 Tax=Coccidioides immitis TaxID=5501 RepID=A0A0J8RCY0_COCIT|nr:hypothetical protein CIRG_00302 [Coccidioides immitis RMSCC 2394]KMU81753.1 hypothetical protein CISG_02771 [Coccidioides immitis RMSCC 3703]KMU84344.1 hypothetical protein CIHG_02130 [Coccidioides immitis H538.4]